MRCATQTGPQLLVTNSTRPDGGLTGVPEELEDLPEKQQFDRGDTALCNFVSGSVRIVSSPLSHATYNGVYYECVGSFSSAREGGCAPNCSGYALVAHHPDAVLARDRFFILVTELRPTVTSLIVHAWREEHG